MYALIEVSCSNNEQVPIGLSLCSWNANGLLRRRAEMLIFIEEHSSDLFLFEETPPEKNQFLLKLKNPFLSTSASYRSY
ncbi:hypothetical protein TNCV_2758081 [Trichonephila clavipes]|nr:hypothetical protein TNCV_2758081 [Trichonephila clavipes]